MLLDAIDKRLVDSVVLHTICLYGHLCTAMEPVENALSLCWQQRCRSAESPVTPTAAQTLLDTLLRRKPRTSKEAASLVAELHLC